MTNDEYVPRHARRRRLLSPRGAGMVAAAVLASTGSATNAFAAPTLRVPPRPTGLPAGIEPFAPYQPQEICYPAAQPGVIAFRDLVLATYPNTGSDGIVQSCSVPGRSEHKDGRAWDWLVRYNIPGERAEAAALLSWLTKRDGVGYTAANARRLGIMYIIWNRRIWKSYQASLGWQPYNGTDAHDGHVHFSFGWAGALGQTSFFTGHVAPPVLAPSLPALSAGSAGPAVLDLQHVLQVPKANGYFGTTTRRAVASFQRVHHIPATGLLTRATWAALLPPATPIPHPVRVRRAWVGSPVLRAGAAGASVRELQRLLSVGTDGSFGPATQTALRRFQIRAHLVPDGVAGARTWNALRVAAARAQAKGRGPAPASHAKPPARGRGAATAATVTRTPTSGLIRLGARGPVVQVIQRRVHVAPDGVFGPATERAVRAYQRRHHLLVDGVVGPRTLPRQHKK
ncbi:MAG: hypothetical protein QOC60_1019 [Frankiaceae bacterium]|nr:hypothetical protein [Frankiaceae bacterium]